MKKTASLFLAVLLLFSLCACGKGEEFVIYESPSGFPFYWYTSVNPVQGNIFYSEDVPKTFSLSLNGQTVQGNYVRSFEKGTFYPYPYDLYETEEKKIKFHIHRDTGKLLLYQNAETSEGKALSASERIALLDRMKEECEKHVSAGWKEHYEYEVDPDGCFMSYYPMVEGMTPANQKKFGVHVKLNNDGTLKSLYAESFPLIERYNKKELEQTMEALRSDRILPAIENRLEKLYSINENTVFIFRGEKDLEKDYRDYEKGEYTSYEIMPTSSNDEWIVSPEGKLGRLVHLSVHATLYPKNGEPKSWVCFPTFAIFLA